MQTISLVKQEWDQVISAFITFQLKQVTHKIHKFRTYRCPYLEQPDTTFPSAVHLPSNWGTRCSAAGHWVRVSMSKTFAMPAPSHIAALLLLFRASAWPAVKTRSHGFGDNESSLEQKDSYRYDNRSSKVLNFFPIPVSVECPSDDGRRTGVCLNVYECRIQGGRANGPCALGFGVCCVFTATCGADIINNITYFVSPMFPALSRDAAICSVQIQKVDPSISQLRLDFIHFNLGQPNRRTGVCDSDMFVMSGPVTEELKLCGQNSGHHVYYDVENAKDPVNIVMNLTNSNLFRMWEIKITQIEFSERAPAGCRQYYQGSSGIIQTMNFAVNGRHLADQDYTICMRQEEGMCSIAYEPCDENSFKIGPPVLSDSGSGDGAVGESRECDDKIVMPCDSEEFIMPEAGGPGVCNLLHCGSSFCSQGEMPCRIESSTTPFNIRVQFGPGTREESPDDNLGMCLRYEQLPCYV